MSGWSSIVDYKAIPAVAEERLTDAYRQVFTGSPSTEDQQIVLCDLAARSGFLQVSPPVITANELYYQEGMRALFARLYSRLALSPSDLEALATEARRQAALLSEAD